MAASVHVRENAVELIVQHVIDGWLCRVKSNIVSVLIN